MKEYLVKEFTATKKEISVLNEKELFHLLHLEGLKELSNRSNIAIFEIGDCIIDWS